MLARRHSIRRGSGEAGFPSQANPDKFFMSSACLGHVLARERQCISSMLATVR